MPFSGHPLRAPVMKITHGYLLACPRLEHSDGEPDVRKGCVLALDDEGCPESLVRHPRAVTEG
jgi:hypothetical protein